MSDLGLKDYAKSKCHLLGKMSYADIPFKEGLIFATYRTLIGQTKKKRTRLQQLIDWCGKPEEFDGLILLDECHKAKNIILDEDGNAKKIGSAECSQTAAAIVELQRCLPRARVVYCSATSVSEPQNLAFMSRLGLWGPGTEHPTGFPQFLQAIKRMGHGSMELHAMHLKSKGAMLARTLSYEGCEFSVVPNVMADDMTQVYNKSVKLWSEMHTALLNEMAKRKEKEIFDKQLQKAKDSGRTLDYDLRRQMDIYADSDDEDEEPTKAENEASEFRKQCRDRSAQTLNGMYWGVYEMVERPRAAYFASLAGADEAEYTVVDADEVVIAVDDRRGNPVELSRGMGMREG